jgi:hypothetical protein
MTPTTLSPHVLATLRTDVRAGRSCIITYDHPDGTGWLDVHGPDGMRGGPDDGAFTSPIPTVRLWPPGGGTAPLAEAVANRAFPRELDQLAERARPLVRDEYPALIVLLTTIREATEGLRFRLPVVGETVRMVGRPSVTAWMSCIPLGNLQAAILQTTNRKAAA